MKENYISKEKSAYTPHPKTELCIALNLARLRFVEVLRYVLDDDNITEENWKTRFQEKSQKLINPKPEEIQKINELKQKWLLKQQQLLKELSIYLPYIKPENDNQIELNMLILIGNLLSQERNYYSHHFHKPIILNYDKDRKSDSVINKLTDLFAEAIDSKLSNNDNGFTKDDMSHLILNDDRKEETMPQWLNPYISKTEPEVSEYALFFKSENGFELSKRGAIFLASLFLDKKEATEILGGMIGFKKTDGNKFRLTREVFTYYCGKVVYDRKDTKNANVSLFFTMVSYLDKKPLEIPAKEGEETRVRDLFGYFATRYLLMDNSDFKIRQFTGKLLPKEREVKIKNDKIIPVSDSTPEKIYSEHLQQKFALTGNNIYFKYNNEKGVLGFKALSQLVFAKLLRNESGFENLYDDVKKKIIGYVKQYKAILEQIKSNKINDDESLKKYLEGKVVKINEIPQAIRNSFSGGKEDNKVFTDRVLRRLKNKIKECDEKLEKLNFNEKEIRIYDIVTFMLQDYMNSIGRNKQRKPGKGLYERLHNNLTFYGRYRGKLIDTLRNKYTDFNNSILADALEETDLHRVYERYLKRLRNWCLENLAKIEKGDSESKRHHDANLLSFKLGLNQKSFESKSLEKHERTSSPKDISDMILDKPIPIPDNFISGIIRDKINLTKDGKKIEQLNTLIDIYIPGKAFDIGRNEKEKNIMLPDFYNEIESIYAKKEIKKIRLLRTHDKLIRLMLGEYAKGFIKERVELKLPDDKPVSELYESIVEMKFLEDKKIKFPFKKYNKVKRLLYDKRIENIIKYNIDVSVKLFEFTDDSEKKFIIDDQKDLFKKSQKRLISASLSFEERFWKNNKPDDLLRKFTKSGNYISHNNILSEIGKDEKFGKMRGNALHNHVPEVKGYFKDAIMEYDKLL